MVTAITRAALKKGCVQILLTVQYYQHGDKAGHNRETFAERYLVTLSMFMWSIDDTFLLVPMQVYANWNIAQRGDL